MLPPIDESVLQNNPDFAKLYQTLTTSILDPNGSSRYDAAQKEREVIREELNSHRLTHAKHTILLSTLSSIVPEASSQPRRTLSKPGGRQSTSTTTATATKPPPPDLLEIILLLPHLLSSSSPSLSHTDLSLLLSLPPLSTLPSHIPHLANLVAASLKTSCSQLARVASPGTNPSYIHRIIPTLPDLASSQTQQLVALKSQLSGSRLHVLQQTTRLVALHARLLVAFARSLDAKHTIVSRHLELDCSLVSLESRIAERDAESVGLVARDAVYTPDAVRALGLYSAHLRDARGRVEDNIRTLETELASYGVGVDVMEQKERAMKEVAKVYRDMGRQIEEVGADLERLGRG